MQMIMYPDMERHGNSLWIKDQNSVKESGAIVRKQLDLAQAVLWLQPTNRKCGRADRTIKTKLQKLVLMEIEKHGCIN